MIKIQKIKGSLTRSPVSAINTSIVKITRRWRFEKKKNVQTNTLQEDGFAFNEHISIINNCCDIKTSVILAICSIDKEPYPLMPHQHRYEGISVIT